MYRQQALQGSKEAVIGGQNEVVTLFTVLFREMGSTGCNWGTLGKNGTGTDEYRTKWRQARYATRKSQKEITQNQKEETMTEDYDKGEDPDLKLVAIVITECLQEGKTTGLADGLCE